MLCREFLTEDTAASAPMTQRHACRDDRTDGKFYTRSNE